MSGSRFIGNEWVVSPENPRVNRKSKAMIKRLRAAGYNGQSCKCITYLKMEFREVVTVFPPDVRMVKYDYYILRLLSRQGRNALLAHADLDLRDVVSDKIRNKADDILFGVVYKRLGWDLLNSCPFYLRWAEEKESIEKADKAIYDLRRAYPLLSTSSHT